MDYIDIYRTNYREAYDRNFSMPHDKKISKEFWDKAPKDIEWGKQRGLIEGQSLQDWMEAKKFTRVNVTDKMKRTIVSSEFIPDELLAEHYGLSRTTIAKIRSSHKESLEVSS
jgi:hypothetical protein